MADCKGTYWAYDDDGISISGGEFFFPQFLDWMPIVAKAFWFRYMGDGPADAKYVLLKSQGEQLLLKEISLRPLTYAEYKEKEHDHEDATNRFIEEQGISRVPRNQ